MLEIHQEGYIQIIKISKVRWIFYCQRCNIDHNRQSICTYPNDKTTEMNENSTRNTEEKGNTKQTKYRNHKHNIKTTNK